MVLNWGCVMARGKKAAARGGSIDAVMVCGHGGCAGGSSDVVEALRPLVVRTPQAMLVRSACLHPAGACDGDAESAGGCWVRMQQCTAELRPMGASTAVRGSATAAFRSVEEWLDRDRAHKVRLA